MSFRSGWFWASNYLLKIGLCYFTVLLPLQPTFLPASLGIMIAGVGWLMMFVFHRHLIAFNSYAAWVVAFFILYYLTGIDFFSKSTQSAEVLSVQIPMLFWGLPFILYYKEFEETFFPLIQKIFIAASILSAIIFLVNFAYIEIQKIPLEYSKRSPFYFLPVHYLGMYYNVALAFLLFGKIYKNNILSLVSAIILISAIILLSARMQWIVLATLTISFALHHIKKLHHIKNLRSGRKVIFFITGSIIILITALFSSEVRRRIEETKDEFKSIKTKNNDKQTNHRVFIWKEAIHLCKSVPLAGFKPGVADSLLMSRLEHVNAEFWDGKKVYYLRDGSYNYHNQFLQAFAERGFGVLFLLGALLTTVFFSVHPATKYIVFVFLFSMLTESILQRQAGVFLVSFFLPYLALFSEKSTTCLKDLNQ